MPSAHSKGDSGDIDLVDIPYVDSAAYDWPSDEGYVLRHLTDFSVIDAMDRPTDLTLTGSDESSGCVTFATGYLVPPKSSSARQRLTTIPVTNYAIDFGNDENRGFWLVDRFGVWYKLVKPSEEYKPLAQFALEFTKEFIKLVDVAVYNKCGGQHVKYIATARKYSCTKTMEVLHEESNHYFDINILRKDLNLLYHRLSTVFTSSCGIMKALGSMLKGPKDVEERKATREPVDTKASSSVEHTSGGRNEVSSKDHKGKISKGNASDKIGVDDSQLQRAAENIEKGKTSIVPKKSASSASPREDSVSMEVSNDDASKLPHPKGDQDRTASPLTISLDATRVPSSSSAASRREASKLAPDWLRSPRAVQTLPAPPPAEASSEGGIKPPSNLIKKKKLSGDKLTLGLSAANPAAQLSEAMESLKELRPLEVGQIFRGKVLSLEPFGAYVSLPSLYGVGMVRTRQVSHFKKIAVPSDILKKGDQVYVKVVEIVEKGPGVAPKIGLSMKYVDQFSGADLDPKGIAYQRDVGIKLSSGGANYSNNNSGHRPSDNSVSSNKTFQNAASNHTAPAAADQRNPKPSTTSAGPVTDAVELALKSTESFDLNKFLAAKFIIEEQIAANLARLENKSTPEGAIDGVGSTAAPPAPTIAKPSAQPEHPAGRGRAATLPAWMTAEKNEAVKRAETQSELVAKPSAAALAGGSDSVLAGGRGRAKTLPAWMTDKTIEVIAANSERESGNTVQQSSSSLPAGPEGDVAILAGTGGGRGKAKTLPAWMTQGGAGSTGSSSLFNQLKGLAEKMAVSSASGKPMNPFPSSSSSSSAPGGRPTQSPSGGSKRRRSRSRDRDRDGDRRERSGGRGDWTGRRRSRSRSPSPYARSSRSSR